MVLQQESSVYSNIGTDNHEYMKTSVGELVACGRSGVPRKVIVVVVEVFHLE